MVDRVTSDFLNCKVDANLTKEEQKKVVQSVELTKALVLMGYNMWSELEPGKYFQSKWEFNLIGYCMKKILSIKTKPILRLNSFREGQ